MIEFTHQSIDSLSKRRMEDFGGDVLKHDGEEKRRVRRTSSGGPQRLMPNGRESIRRSCICETPICADKLKVN